MLGMENSGRRDHATMRLLGDPLPVDRARVAALRRALATGTYVVDPDRIAEAIIAADLPSPRRTR